MSFVTDRDGLREARVLTVNPGSADSGLVVRNIPATGASQVSNRFLQIVDAVATDTTGVKLSYTVPTGKTARLESATWFNNSGTPTVDLEVLRGAITITILSTATAIRVAERIELQAGDVIRWNVTVAAAALSTADATLSIEEF